MAGYKVDIEHMKELKSSLEDILSGLIVALKFEQDELVLSIEPKNVKKVMEKLKNDAHTKFSQISDITAVDYLNRTPRFDVVYQLLSVHNNYRLRIKAPLAEGEAIDTVCDIWSSADWLEREVWDLFGISFNDHPDLRRIMTDFGFKGHPLRKDFPVVGEYEVRYSNEERRIVYEPVDLDQEYREFGDKSVWQPQSHEVLDLEKEGQADE